MKTFLLVVVLSGWVVSSALAQTRAKPIRVTPVSIKETRYIDLKEKKPGAKPNMSWSETSSLVVTVQVRGDAVAKATKYGFVSVNSAVDDTGKQIKHNPKSFSRARKSLVEIDRNMMYMGRDKKDVPEDSIEIELNLETPSREAKRLTSVQGSLKLQTGEPIRVVIDGVRQRVGQTIQNPQLQKCGVEAKIIPAKKSTGGFHFGPDDPSKAVGVLVTGNLDALGKLHLLDGSGEKINGGHSSMTSGGSKTIFLESMDTLPENTKLVMALSYGHKEIAIPFELRNVPLP